MGISNLHMTWATLTFDGFARLRVPWLLVLVWPMIALSAVCCRQVTAEGLAGGDRSGISRSLERRIQRQIIPVLLSSDLETFRFEFSEVIARVSDATAENLEMFGKREGVESFRIALFEAWQDTVLEGRVPVDFKLKLPVLKYLAAGMEASTLKLIQAVERHDLITTTEVNGDWRQSRSLFVDVASFKKQIAELKKMELFLDGALADYRNSPKPKEEVVVMLERFDANESALVEFQNRVLEKEAVFRLQRFNAAAKLILEPRDFEEGLIAALLLSEDAEALSLFFANPIELNDPRLKAPGLVQSIMKTSSAIRSSGSPVVEKARLLSTGLNHWRRGRYGIGPVANGLLKARSQVSGADSLRMPENPTAISRYLGEDSGEGFERRHYYTWDLEYRPLIKRYGKSSETGQSHSSTPSSQWRSQELICTDNTPYTQHTRDIETEIVNVVEDTHRFQNEFAPEDKTIPLRIVGAQEYLAALEQFERLVASSSANEVAVYDNIILQLPEYVFYVGNVSGIDQTIPIAGGQWNKELASVDTAQNVDSQLKKRSLAWLMALARVELGATRSMYRPGADWFVPTPETSFGLDEYYDVLLEDVSVHLQSLEADAQFKRAIKKSFKVANSGTLAYLRRLKMIDSMLVALEGSATPLIAQRAHDFRTEVGGYTEVLTTQVVRSTQAQTLVSRKTNTQTVRGTQTFNETH